MQVRFCCFENSIVAPVRRRGGSMKKLIINILAWVGVILFCTGIALAQEIIPIFGAPKAPIVVINATSDHVPLVAMDTGNNNRSVVVPPGLPGRINVEFFSEQGDASFAINACSSTAEAYHFNNPPEWATDTGDFPHVALTSEYLDSRPSKNNLKDRVDGIKRILHGQLGEKARVGELNAWFRVVKRDGLATKVINCSGAIPIPVRISSATLLYNLGAQTTVTITGDRSRGYYVVYGQYVN